ncbi:MAG: peptidase [Chthonomonadales bacterium]|nr:peptidase [Chthonomonadales bacterium]
MSDIEAEIRRQMLEERDRALRNETSPQSDAGGSLPPASPSGSLAPPSPMPPTGSSYHALPPPAFPSGGSGYPSQYPPSAGQPFTPPPASLPPPTSSSAPKSASGKGWWGSLGAAGIGLAKFGGALKFLTFGKYLITAGSMFVSIVLLGAYYGWWWMGVGVVFLIFLHELGHAITVKRLGYRVTAMVFLPFMGAFVQHERARTAVETAQIAIMGPVAGMLAGLACGAVYGMTGSLFWLILAYFSFYMNLFNLAAIPFLDGGRVTPLIPSKILLAGLLVNLLINFRSPVCWMLLLFALPQITERWRYNTIDPSLGVSKQDQQNYMFAYFAMVLFMGFASLTTQHWIWELRHLTLHI